MENTENIQRLPVLDKKINLVSVEKQKKETIQSLVLNQLLLGDGDIVWVDVNNYATTHIMNRLVPDPNLLERIQVARAFTPYQHYSLIENLVDKIDQDVSLVVLPVFDYLYRDDSLYRGEGEKMIDSAIKYIEDVIDQYNTSILMTETGKYTKKIKECIDEIIRCKITSMGARFLGDDFQTLVYPSNGGLQTTLEFWRRILKETYKSTDMNPKKQKQVVEIYG